MTATPDTEVERPDPTDVEPLDESEQMGQSEAGLDEDLDTSVVLCVQLHLMSEHQMPHALHMEDEDAERHHTRLHDLAEHEHDPGDHRCRPGRAMAQLMAAIEREHEVLLQAGLPLTAPENE
jgi:hypothetical protein